MRGKNQSGESLFESQSARLSCDCLIRRIIEANDYVCESCSTDLGQDVMRVAL